MSKKKVKKDNVLTYQKKTWAVVANRVAAEVYELRAKSKPVSLLKKLKNPLGALKDSALGADRPGRTRDRFSPARHSLSKERSPSEALSVHFAHEIAKELEKGRKAKKFDSLILISAPKFLGQLRACLSDKTLSLVACEFAKDLLPIESSRAGTLKVNSQVKNLLVEALG